MYPQSIPEYNQFRFEALDTADLLDLEYATLEYPKDWSKLLYGAISLLSEVNAFTSDAGLSPEQMVDIYNNNFRAVIVEFCDKVAECIETSQSVSDALKDYLEREGVPNDAVPGGEESIDNVVGSFDCAYGGAVAAVDAILDRAVQLAETVQAGNQYIQEYTQFFPGAATATGKQIFTALNEVAIPLLISELNSSTYREEKYCEMFCWAVSNTQNMNNITQLEMADYQAYLQTTIVGAGLFMYLVSVSYGAGMLAKLYNFGQDECDNNWQLCGCVDKITKVVNVKDSSLQPVALINGASYQASLTGTYSYDGTSYEDDGVYRYDTLDPSTTLQYNGRLYLDQDGTEVSLIPDTYQFAGGDGYTILIENVVTPVSLRLQDAFNPDNVGGLTVVFARVT